MPVVISTPDFKRIARVVKRVERMPHNEASHRRGNEQAQPAGKIFHNTSGEVVPTGALMRVVSCDASLGGHYPVWGIAKPNTTFQRQYLINK